LFFMPGFALIQGVQKMTRGCQEDPLQLKAASLRQPWHFGRAVQNVVEEAGH